jgi:hypothetical protein
LVSVKEDRSMDSPNHREPANGGGEKRLLMSKHRNATTDLDSDQSRFVYFSVWLLRVLNSIVQYSTVTTVTVLQLIIYSEPVSELLA